MLTSSGGIEFSCTKCGRCCQNLNLPLTWDEATAWLIDGGKVDLYCEADLWPSEPAPDDLRACHRKRRSFAAVCGATRLRITAIFVAAVEGPCRNLRPDFTCGIYDRRPLVCRIYPAEINPFIQLDPARKACPPEAWDTSEVFSFQDLVERSRQTDQYDTPQKDLLCRLTRIDIAALHGEGFVKHSLDPAVLLQALKHVRGANLQVFGEPTWRLYSPGTVQANTDRYQFLAA